MRGYCARDCGIIVQSWQHEMNSRLQLILDSEQLINLEMTLTPAESYVDECRLVETSHGHDR